jgi:ABC-2 type transport system permease protein
MSKSYVVMKREFEAMVRSKSFLIGTILLPLILIGIFAFQYMLFTKSGGGDYSIVILDQSTDGVGAETERGLSAGSGFFPGARPVTFRSRVITPGSDLERVRQDLDARVAADSLDGYLLIPANVVSGDQAEYIGRNATSESVTGALKQALQRSVQTIRLGREGINPEKVSSALQPVRMKTTKSGAKGQSGSADLARVLGFAMGMAIYMITMIYGQAVMNGVLEEKKDRIVEVIVSSMRPRELMVGKIFGIGAAGLTQMVLWVLTIVLILKYGPQVATMFGMSKDKADAFAAGLKAFPRIPASVTVTYLLFFLGGFFIYSTLYAMLGAIVTDNKEAQQLILPVMLPIILGFIMLQPAMMNPESGVAVFGSIFPFTAPIIMPARMVVTEVPIWQTFASVALLLATISFVIWLGAKIYRIGIFATGKRATMSEVWRWIRTA